MDVSEYFHEMVACLENHHPSNWNDIARILNQLKNNGAFYSSDNVEEHLHLSTNRVAFITFSYGIDGVSAEISKYARSFNEICQFSNECTIHLIGGNFDLQASSMVSPEWRWQTFEGIDGWDKWDGGQWFEALYAQLVEPHSEASKDLAAEMFSQAVVIATNLGNYFVDNRISLLIPVNIASNPGNFALDSRCCFCN